MMLKVNVKYCTIQRGMLQFSENQREFEY